MSRLRRSLRIVVAAVVMTAVAAGCGASSHSGHGNVTAATPASAVAPPVLPATAVAYLPSRSKPLTPTFLAREEQAPTLPASLARWGFSSGEDRYFQGESRRLTLVDSRTLRFARDAGAQAFVGFQRRHLNSYIGSFATTVRFSSHGRTGFLATGQACACHLANPVRLAAVSKGGVVTWLEINGPRATRHALVALIAQAP